MSSCPPNGGSTPRMDRRLAAIAFVDIVGYSILMARDETRTHQRWMAILNNLLHPQAALHRGRIVKSTGDGVLAEFPSAFDAVQWAADIQRAIPIQNAGDGLPPIVLRIAVHVGDIITTDFDVFGDGVNLAARLQEHAPAGGIVVSEAVHNLVRGSVGTAMRDLGPLDLKNFEYPVRAFALDIADPHIEVPHIQSAGRLPSIAVLPLENIGGNPADDYFCDGCVEDITLSLAGLHELMVISRGSTLAYRGRRSDPREVGRMFGVRYVLSGSLRRSERQVRVSVELCDTQTGTTLWGEKSEVSSERVVRCSGSHRQEDCWRHRAECARRRTAQCDEKETGKLQRLRLHATRAAYHAQPRQEHLHAGARLSGKGNGGRRRVRHAGRLGRAVVWLVGRARLVR